MGSDGVIPNCYRSSIGVAVAPGYIGTFDGGEPGCIPLRLPLCKRAARAIPVTFLWSVSKPRQASRAGMCGCSGLGATTDGAKPCNARRH